MNKENIAKLIKAIEFDGQAKFNMSSFIGKITDSTFDKQKIMLILNMLVLFI